MRSHFILGTVFSSVHTFVWINFVQVEKKIGGGKEGKESDIVFQNTKIKKHSG